MMCRVLASSLCTAVLLTGVGCASPAVPAPAPATPLGTAAQKWAAAEQPPSFVAFFAGTFTRLGVTVVETGEQFTVVHRGDRFTFEGGAQQPDFIVPLRQENVDSLVSRAGDGLLDDEDAYAIMAVLFTPLTREILKHSISADNALRVLSGVEDRIHVVLVDASGEDGVSHTLSYADGKWSVEPGLIGTAERTFRMNAQQALEYQRHAYAAIKASSAAGWIAFGSWYKEWRQSCSTVSG